MRACVRVFVLIAVLLSLLYVAAFLYTGQRFWTECHTQCRSVCFSHSLRHLAVAGESVVAVQAMAEVEAETELEAKAEAEQEEAVEAGVRAALVVGAAATTATTTSMTRGDRLAQRAAVLLR